MKQQYVKTTVEIDPDLLYQAKLKALQQGKSFKDIVHETMIRYIREPERKVKFKKIPRIGGYHLGSFKTKLRRTDIYDYI